MWAEMVHSGWCGRGVCVFIHRWCPGHGSRCVCGLRMCMWPTGSQHVVMFRRDLGVGGVCETILHVEVLQLVEMQTAQDCGIERSVCVRACFAPNGTSNG